MADIQLNIDSSFFNEAYLPYLDRPEKFQVFYGGAGSGKSYHLATSLLIKLLQQKQKLLVVRQTFSSHRDSTFSEFKTALERMGIINHCGISKTTLEITLPNGSTIIFKGADDENKLLSISGITLTWVEEATEISKEIFDQLVMRMRGGRLTKHMFLSFNPISATHWLKKEFFDNPRENSFVCHTTYKDNRFLEQDYINNLLEMEERNPLKYAIYALGEWGTTGKKVYENYVIKDFNRYEVVKNNITIQSAFGLDFGFTTDPSVLVAVLVDMENRKLYIFDEMYQHGLLNNEIADEIVHMGYQRERIIADSAEKKSIEEIQGYDIPRIEPAQKGNGSINQGIQFIQQFTIYIDPKCKHIIEEFNNYSYKKDKSTGLYLNTPIDNYNHLLDALRYAMEPFHRKKNRKIKTMSKRMFGL